MTKAKALGSIPVSAAHTFMPYVEFLIKVGAPVDRWLERCKLPFHIYEDPYTYLPTMKYWEFVALAEQKEGMEDLGLRVSHERIFYGLGHRLLARIHAAPTLRAGIGEFARLVGSEYSGMQVRLTRGEDDSVHLILDKTFNLEVPGFQQTEWMGLMALIAVVQFFAGRTWQPEVISLRSKGVIPPLASALYSDVRFLRAQPTSFISFPRALLSRCPSSHGADVVSSLASDFPKPEPATIPSGTADSLERLLASYLPDGYPTVEKMAAIGGMSPRTLQRRLSSDGLSYSKLVNRVRFNRACRMLKETDASSLDIALATGYEDPSHFARAFRRIAGCSPRDYRRQNAVSSEDDTGN